MILYVLVVSKIFYAEDLGERENGKQNSVY